MAAATPPARILIVDDDRRVREVVHRLLERSGGARVDAIVLDTYVNAWRDVHAGSRVAVA